MPSKHKAAVLNSLGGSFVVSERTTPEPGPNEVLIQVKAAAVNPVDAYQRDKSTPPIASFPAVLGSDVAGVVAKLGSDVPNALHPGTRVLALATGFYQNGSPDHGAFQEYVLTKPEMIAALPDHTSFEEGSILPLAALTALSAYTTMGMTLDTKFTPEDKQAILIWGASSSVGSMAVQSAKLMGYTVYATAGAANSEYVMKLGADGVFDYKEEDVVTQIVDRAKSDGNILKTAHVIVDDSLQQTLDVMKQTKGDGHAKVAHAPLLPDNAPALENTEIKFTFPPTEPGSFSNHLKKCFGVWLQDGLESGKVVPSPRVEVVPGGLGGLNKALDKVRAGVSGTKLVVTL